MARTMKRLACLTLTVVMLTVLVVAGALMASAEDFEHCYLYGDVMEDGQITNMDAIQLLYIYLGVEEMPAYQDLDIDGDGQITNLDAIELLYLYMLGTKTEVVHAYFAPVWDWSDPSNVSVTFRCGCGKSHTYPDDSVDVTVTTVRNTAVTCTAAGVVERKATVTVDGKEYSSTNLVETPATGHTVDDEGITCADADRHCANCDYVVEAPLHSWKVTSTDPATCLAKGVEHQQCINCQKTRDVELEGEGSCVFAYVRDEKLPAGTMVEGTAIVGNCSYAKIYECISCHERKPVDSYDVYSTHIYKVTTTQETEATCMQDGVRTYICTNDGCGHSYPEEVKKDPNKHVWGAGQRDGNGYIVYKCECSATKKLVDVKTSGGKVNTDVLKDEVALPNDANMTMSPEAQEGLPKDTQVEISVGKTDTNDPALNLDEALKQQIGNNPVYDFSMSIEGTNEAISSFDGYVTISLPYTLQDGEDVDNINVWYIADDGQVTAIKGTYSNGFVTFQTNHFSYYTVTRLTPAQRCELYGHVWTETYRAATCTVDGVDSKICQRCGTVDHNDALPAAGHSYVETGSTATCTEDGVVTKACEKCLHKVTAKVDKLGHTLEANKQLSVEATCKGPGKEVSTCSRCNENVEKIIPQKQHQYGEVTHVKATCTAGGYDEESCTFCGHKHVFNETAATGHSYKLSGDWAWGDEYTTATALLVCANDPTHVHTLKGNINVTSDKVPCVGNYTLTYLAAASFNNVTYTDAKSVKLEGPGHTAAQGWSTNGTQHYHACTNCGEAVDAANHSFKDVSVDQLPTCTKPGSKTVECAVCGYKKSEAIPATGEHTYADRVCTSCGKEDDSCEHLITYPHVLDTSALGICGDAKITVYKCDCGMVQDAEIEGLACKMEETEKEDRLPDGTVCYHYISVCSVCGLTVDRVSTEQLDEESCVLRYTDTMILTLGDAELLRTEYEKGEELHPCTVDVREVTLTGFCGDPVFVLTTCPCGKATDGYWKNGRECNFQQDPELSTENEAHFVCDICGGYQRTSVSAEVENCLQTVTRPYEFAVNGQVMLEFVAIEIYPVHNDVLDSYELLGETCEDGLIARYTCADCGEKGAYYAADHAMILEEAHPIAGMCGGGGVVVRKCPCSVGITNVSVEGAESCRWVYNSYDPETGLESFACEKCGTGWSELRTVGEKDENCIAEVKTVHTLTDKAGNVLGTFNAKQISYDHNRAERVELNGDSCLDGGRIYVYCADCGMEYGYGEFRPNEGHQNGERQQISLAEMGFCDGYIYVHSCYCGEEGNISLDLHGCEMEWLDDDNRHCQICGLTVKTEAVLLKDIDDCHKQFLQTVTLSKDGTAVKMLTSKYVEEYHRSTATFTLLGETCNDGYYFKRSCIICGEVQYDSQLHGDVWYGHDWFVTEIKEVYSGEDTCGPLYLYRDSCACGLRQDLYISASCNWEGFWNDETGEHYSYCTECGIKWYNEVVSDEPGEGTCQRVEIRKHTFVKGEEKIFSQQIEDQYADHAIITEFTLLGETCEDGYYIKQYCTDCGYVEFDGAQFDEIMYGHSRKLVSFRDAANGQACGPIQETVYSCACGQDRRVEVEYDDCRFQQVGYDPETSTEYYLCEACGLEKERKVYNTPTGEPCRYYRETIEVFLKDGVELTQSVNSYYYGMHRNEKQTLTLLGETCNEGYTVAGVCMDCGQELSYSDTFYGCDDWSWSVELTPLCNVEGGCGSLYLAKRASCPCEKNINYTIQGICSLQQQGGTENGEIYRCQSCGVEVTRANYGIPVEGQCLMDWTFDYTVTFNGETVAEGAVQYQREGHNTYSKPVLQGESCEDGYTVSDYCRNCDYVQHDSCVHTDHTIYDMGELDTSALGCCNGSTVRVEGCACGKYGSLYTDLSGCDVTWEYDASETKDTERESCSKCGLEYYRERTYTPTDVTCEYTRVEVSSLSVYGETKYAFTTSVTAPRHDEQYTATLKEGSMTCEDGITVVISCASCSYSYSYETEHHYTMEKQVIDLAQYGSVCGGALVNASCACGQNSSWRIDGCNPDYQDVKAEDYWIDNVLNSIQFTSEGNDWTDSYFQNVICAVTDPACSLHLRKASYWRAEDCIATQYINWQRYDEATGEWVDLVHEPTGMTRPYHNYVEKQEADREGYDYWVVCSQCQSYHRYVYNYDAQGNLVSYVEEAVELTDHGFNQKQTVRRSYMQASESTYVITEDERLYTNAQGVVDAGWRITYSYDFDNCTRVTTHYDPNGNMQEEPYTDEHHLTEYKQTVVKQNTCSQVGYYKDEHICKACGKTVESYQQILQPICHSFSWNDELQTYVCSVCDLENANGASGSIVLEDMTDARGEGVNYVIGYYNHENIQFVVNASVILHDAAEGEQDQILLTGITFDALTESSEDVNSINAYTCNIQQVQAAALEALGEYTGSYAIRISFVPTGSGSDLDYAITLDSQNKA